MSSTEQRPSRGGRTAGRKEPAPKNQPGGTTKAKRPPKGTCLRRAAKAKEPPTRSCQRGTTRSKESLKLPTKMERQRPKNQLVATKQPGRTCPRETAETKKHHQGTSKGKLPGPRNPQSQGHTTTVARGQVLRMPLSHGRPLAHRRCGEHATSAWRTASA